MTGPEHYREAERLLVLAHNLADQGHQDRADFILARAQIHAGLASTAATVEAAGLFKVHRATGWPGPGDPPNWPQVAAP